MAEIRLIDANAVEAGFDELCRSPYFKNDVNAKRGAETLMDLCVRTDSNKPNTIDPETLPIVRQLREELARVTEERDAAVDVDKAILWLERYTFNDSEEVYTNGSKLVPYFRVLQALKDRAYNGLREAELRGPQKEE